MALPHASPYLDEELRRRLGGPAAPQGAPLPLGMPGPVGPGDALPPAPPPPPTPRMPPVADPLVAEYARRYTGEPPTPPMRAADAGSVAAPEAAAEPAGDVAAAKQLPRGELTSGEETAMWIDALASGLSHLGTLGRRRIPPTKFDPGFYQEIKDRRTTEMREDEAAAQQQQQKQRAAAEADPRSELSARARAPHIGMLRQLGLQDSEIAAFSAADIRDLTKGGNLGMKIAEVRQRALADAAEQQRKAQEAEAKRIADQEEWNRRNAITSEQGMERARTMAGISTGRMVQGALLHDDLARRRAAEEEQRRIEAEKRRAALEGKPDPDTYSLPGTEVTNPERFNQALRDDVQRRKLEDAVAAFRTMQESLKQMQELRKKHGIEVKDEGVISQYNTARNNYMAGQAVLAGTGVINPGEREIFVESLPDISGSPKDLKRIIPGSGDPVLGALEGTERAVFGGINAKLDTLGGVRLANPNEKTQRADAPARRGPATSARDVNGDGKVSVSDLPRRVRIGGEEFEATPDQIQQMKADGVSFEELE